jgi:hypothetical protein
MKTRPVIPHHRTRGYSLIQTMRFGSDQADDDRPQEPERRTDREAVYHHGKGHGPASSFLPLTKGYCREENRSVERKS